MSINAASLGIDRLSVGERLELIEQIWDSLPQQVSPGDIPQWHLDELARRLDAAAANPDDDNAEISARLSRRFCSGSKPRGSGL